MPNNGKRKRSEISDSTELESDVKGQHFYLFTQQASYEYDIPGMLISVLGNLYTLADDHVIAKLDKKPYPSMINACRLVWTDSGEHFVGDIETLGVSGDKLHGKREDSWVEVKTYRQRQQMLNKSGAKRSRISELAEVEFQLSSVDTKSGNAETYEDSDSVISLEDLGQVYATAELPVGAGAQSHVDHPEILEDEELLKLYTMSVAVFAPVVPGPMPAPSSTIRIPVRKDALSFSIVAKLALDEHRDGAISRLSMDSSGPELS